MSEFLDRLRHDTEPTRTALAMADAIHQHLDDLLTDDPGDHDAATLHLVRKAKRYATALHRVLHALNYETDI
jgi:hypothetical protein